MSLKRKTLAVLFGWLVCGAVCAATAIPWRVPLYTLTARSMNVRQALETFGVAEGIPVVMSDAVAGVFSGAFKDIPAGEFLDRLATVHNLAWYYDGATLYVYGSGEVVSTLINLSAMKADEVRTMLRDLGVEDVRYPIKTASEDELIMVSGPPRYVQLVSQTISHADALKLKRTVSQVETRVFPLRHAWADSVSLGTSSPESNPSIRGVAQILEEMVNGDSTTTVKDASTTNAVPDVFQQASDSSFRPVIRAENRLNAVVVRDTAARMPMYEKLIAELDRPQPLVEIGITVVELTKKDALDWGLSLRAGGANSRRVNGAAGQNVDNLMSPDSISGKGLSGALTFLGSDWDLEASLTALKTKGKARNISRTSLLTMNNMAAELTDTQSYHAKVIGERTAALEKVSAGTELRIKPHIVPSHGRADEKDQIWLTVDLDDGGFETVNVEDMPMTRSSKVETQAGVYEGESLMLAGYLRDIREKAGWGIPYLRDIPWIGWIFGGYSDNNETVQRIFIFTPHVVNMDSDELFRRQASRNRDVSSIEKVEKDLEESDDEREIRERENEAERDRRREQTKDRLERRKAELERDRQWRNIDRVREHRKLEQDREDWKRALEEAKDILRREDEEAAKAAK